MKRMDYKDTIEYLYARLPMYQKVGKPAFKKDLTNIVALSKHLGYPHNKYKTIHVAGTNGKGTVAHLMAAALQAHGLKVGVYTSPHYKDFRERIKINGVFISEDEVCNFVADNEEIIEETKPSFFELTVAMAFHHFKAHEVDIAVIETGLGGTFDSTNIIHPIMSVITNISLDHQSILGESLEEIAEAKAGIIKYGVPVVIGEYQSEVFDVFSTTALRINSALGVADENVAIRIAEDNTMDIVIKNNTWISGLRMPYMDAFLLINLRTAIYTLHLLTKKLNLNVDSMKSGLSNFKELTKYIGRMEVLQSSPKVIVDSAHNKAAIKLLMLHVAEEKYDNLHIVLGRVRDKDFAPVLPFLIKEATYYYCQANVIRAMDAEDLRQEGEKEGLIGKAYPTVTEAYEAALNAAGANDLIVVCGSIFVAAEVL